MRHRRRDKHKPAAPKDVRAFGSKAEERAYREMLAQLAEREFRLPAKRVKHYAKTPGQRRLWAGVLNFDRNRRQAARAAA